MKIPTPTKGADGLYKIQLRLNGKSIIVRGTTAAECKREATAVKAEHLTGRVRQQRCTLTLTDAIDRYISARPKLSPSTIRGYRVIQRNMFPGAMTNTLDSIKWQSVIDAETHAPKTVKNAWGFVSSVLAENGISVPKVRLPAVVTNDRPFLQPEEIQAFLDAVRDTTFELAALLGLHSLRRSEMCDMTMDDVDLRRGLLHVRGAAVPDEDNRIVHKTENKNSASTRSVPIMIPRLTELLTQMKDDGVDGYLIKHHPNSIYKAINTICKRNGLPEVGVHGLRHSAVSLAYHLGWSELTSMRVFGYSDYNTMRKIYTHLADEDRKKDVQSMSDFFSVAKS